MSFTIISIIVAVAVGWLCLAVQLAAALRFAAGSLPAPDLEKRPPISVLKPLHGAEPGLYQNLRSFIEQDYPAVQIVFGVNDPEDAALDDVRAVVQDFPAGDTAIVIDRQIRGSNQKVSNLENMLPAARHGILVLADSDMRVERNYLGAVTAPLHDSRIGAVTCLYKGRSTGGLWSDLGAMQINFGFVPNALLADVLGIGGGCFGATIALSRATLDSIGGFVSLRDELADDHRLGAAVRAGGLSVALSRYLVEAQVYERSLSALWRHELRWARTNRQLAPVGFACSVVTHPVAIALIAALLTGFDTISCVLLGMTIALRYAAAGIIARRLGLPTRRFWLLPSRDALSFAEYVASFVGRKVFWRDQNFAVEPTGRMTAAE
jgi:ceramide glucosyltransferase